MKKNKTLANKSHRNWGIMMLVVVLIVLPAVLTCVSWAQLNINKTKNQALQNAQGQNRSRAPEPSTFVLFGGGILGIIGSFLRSAYAATKRGVDIVGSIIGIIILSPVCLAAVLLIKITSQGPVIFKQKRLGKNGETFEIYKFRTMKVDAEKYSGPVWASQNDARLIPVGNFLRQTHIDEIPQFINVLNGDMSIVGPRPERPFFVEKLKHEISDYEKRLRIKPGITGLAQVYHRADETTRDVKIKVKYDLLYIKKMSLLADLMILYRTLRLVIINGISSI